MLGDKKGPQPGSMITTGKMAPDLPVDARPAGSDPISIPSDGRSELDLRRDQLRQAFDRDNARLRPPSQSALLDYFDSRWKHDGTLSEWLPQFFADFLDRRDQFLHDKDGPFASRLADLLRREIYLAAWVQSTGSPSTADLLLRDIVELAVYAGSEPGRGPDRLWHLDLPLTLAFPWLIRSKPVPSGTELMEIGAPALRAVERWAGGNPGALFQDGKLSLDDLYIGWTTGDLGRPPALAILSAILPGEKKPEWTNCPDGRLCRWFFVGRKRTGPSPYKEIVR
jgi:hypothetical protein